MSRSLNGSSDYLRAGASALGASFSNCSMAAWINPTVVNVQQTICGIYIAASANAIEQLAISSAGALQASTEGAGGGTVNTGTKSGVTASVWQHVAGTRSSGTHIAYLNGSAGTPNVASPITTSGMNRTSVGVQDRSSQAGFFSGLIAEVAMWNVVLTAAEIAALATGTSPRYVRPLSVVGYWPLWGLHSPEIDLTGSANNLVLSGTAAGNHAPVARFTRDLVGAGAQPVPVVPLPGATCATAGAVALGQTNGNTVSPPFSDWWIIPSLPSGTYSLNWTRSMSISVQLEIFSGTCSSLTSQGVPGPGITSISWGGGDLYLQFTNAVPTGGPWTYSFSVS